MGSFISRFRKKPTTEDQLKKIEDGLRKIEDYKRSTERKHKKLVASIIIYSAALYMISCIIVFVWYLPESWMIRLGLLIPLVLVPVIIYLLKRLISKYFDSRMVKANEEYSDLQRKKKDIIDSVMETETFNKAKEILSKYAPEKLDKKEQSPLPRLQLATTTDLRKRVAAQPVKPEVANTITRAHADPITSLAMVPRRDLSPMSSVRSGTALKQRLPQPVFPKERGISDKLIEFMIGDGPGYRYALICTHCRGHNGMALKEEFPYMAFNCCYCYQYNPARSKRPVPPKLPVALASTPALPAALTRQSEPSEPQEEVRGDPVKEGDKVDKIKEERVENAEEPEAGSSDLKSSENLESEDISEEKSDDDFQKLGFSESDLEFLKKFNPQPLEPEVETQGGPTDKEV